MNLEIGKMYRFYIQPIQIFHDKDSESSAGYFYLDYDETFMFLEVKIAEEHLKKINEKDIFLLKILTSKGKIGYQTVYPEMISSIFEEI